MKIRNGPCIQEVVPSLIKRQESLHLKPDALEACTISRDYGKQYQKLTK